MAVTTDVLATLNPSTGLEAGAAAVGTLVVRGWALGTKEA